MKVAFHFQASAGGDWYGDFFEQQFFKQLLSTQPNKLHLKIFIGDLLLYEHRSNIENVLRSILGMGLRNWIDMDAHRFLDCAAAQEPMYVIVVDALPVRMRDKIHGGLKKCDGYLGAIEVYEKDPKHWVLYNQYLIPKYRVVDRELRLLHCGEDGKDQSLYEERSALPFDRVVWEDLGARHSVFDPYDSYESAERLAELSTMLTDHLSQLVADIMLRLRDQDPGLGETLFSAMRTFQGADTVEDRAQVAISCRRFLNGLADALFPPTETPQSNRKLDGPAYRNRLWEYVRVALDGGSRDLLHFQLQDVGNRIDRLDQLANKGVHSKIAPMELHRLLVGLIILTHDLLSLTPPPFSSSDAYDATTSSYIDDLMKRYKDK